MEPQPQGNYQMLDYRVKAVERELQGLKSSWETDIREIKALLPQYVTQRENELQLKSMRETMERVEKSVTSAVERLEKAITDPDSGLQKQIQSQQTSQDKLVIRILWGFASTIIAIAVVVAGYYFTHLP